MSRPESVRRHSPSVDVSAAMGMHLLFHPAGESSGFAHVRGLGQGALLLLQIGKLRPELAHQLPASLVKNAAHLDATDELLDVGRSAMAFLHPAPIDGTNPNALSPECALQHI